MPLYDYQCSACGTVFEVEHAMSAKPQPKCPQCGSAKTEKVFSPAGVQFKGGGFYVTDSRGSAGNSAGTSKDITPVKGAKPDDSAAPKPATDSPAGKSESKPAADATAAPKKSS